MMDDEELRELAERCDRATEPSHDIDGDIHYGALDWRASCRQPPRYTASIDEAAKLVPPECLWNIKFEYTDGKAAVRIWFPNEQATYQAFGLPALAICAAALRARAAIAIDARRVETA